MPVLLVSLFLFQHLLQDDFIQRLLPFDHAYTDFKVELLGCPESYKKLEILDASKCDRANGTISTKGWILLRKRAMQAFELQEIPEK